MAMLNFKMGLFKNLNSVDKKAGTVYITTDEQAMYVDISNDKRIRINQIITYNTFNEFKAAIQQTEPPYSTEAFYYIVDENALLKYVATGGDFDANGDGQVSGKWIQVNTTTDVQLELNNVKNRITTLETFKTGIDTWQTGVNESINEFEGEIESLKIANQTLQTNIDNEAITRANAIIDVTNLITNETSARQEAIEGIRKDITDLGEDLSDEITRATRAEEAIYKVNADGTKSGALADEITRATGVESDLNGKISQLQTTVNGELNTIKGNISKNAEDIAAINTTLTTHSENISELETNLSTEKSRAELAEQNLGQRIDNEAAVRSASDITHTTNIAANAEEIAKNKTAIEKEITDRQEAISDVSKAIADEKKRAEDKEAELAASIEKKMQEADAMKYKGTVDGKSDSKPLPTTDVRVGDTYKATAEFDLNGQHVYIGDLLIASGVEDTTTGIITSDLAWDYVPAGFVADYNPQLLATDSSATVNPAIILKRGDETENMVEFISESDSLKIESTSEGLISLSLEWGSF